MTKKEVSKKTNKKNHRNQRGITLIALVITIIVMLILVAVTVTVAINGGLFGMAKEAKTKTEEARDVEQELANGRILVGDTWYDSMEDYVNGTPSENQNDDSAGGGSGTGHEGTYDATPKNEDGTLTANATYDTATIPAGFMVSEKKEEQEIEEVDELDLKQRLKEKEEEELDVENTSNLTRKEETRLEQRIKGTTLRNALG